MKLAMTLGVALTLFAGIAFEPLTAQDAEAFYTHHTTVEVAMDVTTDAALDSRRVRYALSTESIEQQNMDGELMGRRIRF